MSVDKSMACFHGGANKWGVDPKKHDAAVRSILAHPEVSILFAITEKAKADPSCAEQCMIEGDERLLLTLSVVDCLCDYVIAEWKAAGGHPGKRVATVKKAFDKLAAEIAG